MDAGHRETDEVIGKMEKQIAQIYGDAEKELQTKLDKHLAWFKVEDEARREMLENGEISQKQYNGWRREQMMTETRLKAMRETIAQDLHNSNNIARSVVNGYMPEVYAINHNFGTFQVEHDALVDTSYTLYDRQTVERLMRDDPDLLPPLSDSKSEAKAAAKDIRWQSQQFNAAMTKSILMGDSIPNMAARISNDLIVSNMNAAVRYARTAATGAQNAGRVDSYERAQNMGIELEQEWLATLDNRTRDEHRELDGQHVPVGEPFEVDGEEIRYPGDPSAPGYLVWNCRCTLVPKLKNLDQSDAPRYSKLGDMSYEEWKNEHQNNNIPNDTSIGDLIKPIRPLRSEYGGITEEYLEAKDRYKLEKEQYEARIDRAVSASASSTVFTSTEELLSWAEKNGISIDPEVLESIDIRSFNEVVPTLEDLFQRFPEVNGYTMEDYTGEIFSSHFNIGITDDALLSANGGFNLNPQYFGNYEDGVRIALNRIAEGTLVRGDGSFSTLVRHEYGHTVQHYTETKIVDKYHMNVDDWRMHYETLDEYKDAQAQYRSERERYERELMSLAGLSGSSEYSNTNTYELFAEGFAEWSSGGNTEFGKAFGEFLMRWY